MPEAVPVDVLFSLKAGIPKTDRNLSTTRRQAVVLRRKANAPMGQKRHFDHAPVISGLPQKADVHGVSRYVSNVPKPDITR